jgi:7,8-dihydropterin-6-yl-methyl-4-(beta-D-ribofuranosyl)aminobenzene 5'-phosphate synthase
MQNQYNKSGICNIVEYVKQVCNNNNVLRLIGGFHLFNDLDICKNN